MSDCVILWFGHWFSVLGSSVTMSEFRVLWYVLCFSGVCSSVTVAEFRVLWYVLYFSGVCSSVTVAEFLVLWCSVFLGCMFLCYRDRVPGFVVWSVLFWFLVPLWPCPTFFDTGVLGLCLCNVGASSFFSLTVESGVYSWLSFDGFCCR